MLCVLRRETALARLLRYYLHFATLKAGDANRAAPD